MAIDIKYIKKIYKKCKKFVMLKNTEAYIESLKNERLLTERQLELLKNDAELHPKIDL